MQSDEGDGPLRSVLVGLGALVGASLLIGGIVSLVALGAVRVAGVSEDSGSATSSEEPSLFLPSPSERSQPAEPSESSSPQESATKTPKQDRPRITLSARPRNVGAGERINFDGTYRNGNGATLQVQRFEGGWVDFPTTATVRDGEFSTYIFTGRTGKNRFRVVDESSGRSSDPVTVTVG